MSSQAAVLVHALWIFARTRVLTAFIFRLEGYVRTCSTMGKGSISETVLQGGTRWQSVLRGSEAAKLQECTQALSAACSEAVAALLLSGTAIPDDVPKLTSCSVG